MTSILDVRTLSQTRESLVVQDGGLFPVLTVANDGTIVGVVRGGSGHLGARGRIEIIRSRDAGVSWTPPAVIADTDVDDRNPALGVAQDGTIVLAYHRQGSLDENGMMRFVPREPGTEIPIQVMWTKSHDAGINWDPVQPLTLDLIKTGSPFGKIARQADGTLLMGIYVHDHAHEVSDRAHMLTLPPDRYGSYLVRSRDGGATWEEPSLIAPAMDEAGLLVLPDGDILALLRGSDNAQALWASRSHDGGYVWTDPVQVTGTNQLPADLCLLANGDVLLSYGNRTSPYRIEGRIGRDGGRDWADGVVTFSGPLYGYDLTPGTRRTDLGYPSTVVVRTGNSARGVTVYYVNPSIPRTGNWRDEGPSGPLYSASGYRAIAITWDEAEFLDSIARQFE